MLHVPLKTTFTKGSISFQTKGSIDPPYRQVMTVSISSFVSFYLRKVERDKKKSWIYVAVCGMAITSLWYGLGEDKFVVRKRFNHDDRCSPEGALQRVLSSIQPDPASVLQTETEIDIFLVGGVILRSQHQQTACFVLLIHCNLRYLQRDRKLGLRKIPFPLPGNRLAKSWLSPLVGVVTSW